MTLGTLEARGFETEDGKERLSWVLTPGGLALLPQRLMGLN